MTAVYDRSGIQFMYPENWKIIEDDMENLPRTVSIESPTGALWSVDIHLFSVDMQTLLDQTLQAFQQEYYEVESGPAEEVWLGETVIGYDLDFVCLDFVVICQLRALRHGHATYLITFQAEDREFQKMQQVFRAIAQSMLSENNIRVAEKGQIQSGQIQSGQIQSGQIQSGPI